MFSVSIHEILEAALTVHKTTLKGASLVRVHICEEVKCHPQSKLSKKITLSPCSLSTEVTTEFPPEFLKFLELENFSYFRMKEFSTTILPF